MPNIYVLLSKGFVVNDGRLAWPGLALGWVFALLDCFQWHFKLHMLCERQIQVFFSFGLGISCLPCDAGNKFDL